MGAPSPRPIHPLAALAAGASSLLITAALSRVPDVGGVTLGLLSPRLGGAVLAAGAAGGLALLLGRRPVPWRRALLGAALFLAAVQALDLDVTRRRRVLMAAGLGAMVWIAGRPLNRVGRWTPWAYGIATAGCALGIAGLVDLDGRPYRTWLPPIDAATAPPGAPDIVLITMDTTVQGVESPSAAFPYEGALAAFRSSAIEFRSASAEASHTHPSMASLATSRWPLEHGSISTSPAMDPRLPTLAEHLRSHGYRTAGFVENPWLGPGFGLDRGYELLARRARLDDIEAWLDGDDPRPAFLHVHLFEPHGPYELRPWALELLDRPIDREARARLGDEIGALYIRNGEVPGAHSLGPADFEWLRTIYLTEIVAMDRWIGTLMEALERRDPALKNTVLAVTSDHGEEFGEHGALHHSHTLYGELIRIPLMLRIPGESARADDRPAGLIDVAPTLLDAAHLPPLPGAAGRSLLEEPATQVRPLVATRFHERGAHRISVQLGEWKLHRRVDAKLTNPTDPLGLAAPSAQTELYRISVDPGETANLANENGDVVEGLLNAALAWQRNALERMSDDDQRYGSAAGEPGELQELDAGAAQELRGFGYSLGESSEAEQAPR